MNKLPVVAAIANYNMATELANLLPQVSQQGYSDIFVLDDASTDYSREVVESFSNEVHFVAGDKNKGAGANRNRIIEALGYDALIHFLDADINLESEGTAELVQEVIPNGDFGFVGGLAKSPTGLQNVWNYGPRQSLRNDIGAQIIARIEPLLTENPARVAKIRNRYSDLLSGWPDPLNEPVRRQVFWNIEQNLVMNSSTFKTLDGFDESLREHEIQDLAIRLSHLGLISYFDPLISIVHTEGQVRNYNRKLAMMSAEFHIIRKHGLIDYIAPLN